MAVCNDQTITSTSELLEGIPPISRQGLKMISCMPWVRVYKSFVAEVKEARFFSLLADETTDASTKQLTICLRYVKNGSICERFFGLREASNLTGSGLANQLLATLTTAGIPVSYMVGQSYDGAAAMSGCKNGVQKYIRDKYPAAMYVHCISHC